jgi:hypothetical protein
MCIEYFRLISIVFISKYTNQVLVDSKSKIKAALATRPDTLKELNSILKKIKLDLIFKPDSSSTELDFSEIEDSCNESECEEDDGSNDQNSNADTNVDDDFDMKEYNPFKQDSIKSSSPFTKIFQDVYDQVLSEISNETNDGVTNDLYCPELIEHLLKNYMPYCFLWSGFVLCDTGLTRLTNGVLENYNGIRKKKVTKNQLPSQYINRNFDLVNGHAIEYLNTIEQTKKKNQLITIKSKRKTPENEPTFEEKKKHEVEETWAKSRNSLLITGEKPCGMGYQRKVAVETISLQNHHKKARKVVVNSDIDALLKPKSWLNNFVIESYIASFIDPSKMFMINSEVGDLIFQRNVELLNDVS